MTTVISPLMRTHKVKFEKTKELILTFVRSMKRRSYDECNGLLYNIRTNDLRDILKELGPGHLFYRTLLDVLKKPIMEECHAEALYNLAVVLGDKGNVPGLFRYDILDIVWGFTSNGNPHVKYRALWCLFGISAADPESRDACLKHGLLGLAIQVMLIEKSEQIIDMCGQIIYGMFHMRPMLEHEYMKPLLDHSRELMSLQESTLKYVLWSLHFASAGQPEILLDLGIGEALGKLLKSTQATLLIPLLVILGGLFRNDNHDCDKYVADLMGPLAHVDSGTRLQACRTIADYVRDEDSVKEFVSKGLCVKMIELANEPGSLREQSVYSVLRCFGCGTVEQRREIAELGGIGVVLTFAPIAGSPFNANLMDCMATLIEDDPRFFTPKLQALGGVAVFYELLTAPDVLMNSKAANLLGLIGDGYVPPE